MKTRIIVVPIIKNGINEYLICKMSNNRGVFPGQWGLPGGGIDEGEKFTDALKREVKEELGITIKNITPWSFRDDLQEKLYVCGKKELIYMIYLIFDCFTSDKKIILNEELTEYKWLKKQDFKNYDLNEATKLTFKQKGFDI